MVKFVNIRLLSCASLSALWFLSCAAVVGSELQNALLEAQDAELSYSDVVEPVGTIITRPFWAIAHRVLDKDAVTAALGHGANALEIDMQPWDRSSDMGWWACHDRTPTGWGDTAEEMFQHIALARRNSANVTFVWLDIKEPATCNTENQYRCSVMALQDLARQFLLPAGVQVMYGLYGSETQMPDSPTYNRLARRGLIQGEALNIDGGFDTVSRAYEMNEQGLGRYPALPLDKTQRTMAKGLFSMFFNFPSILSELRIATSSDKFGRRFGWTILDNSADADRATALVSVAGVDGLIYGNMVTNYDDSSSTRAARQNIEAAVQNNKETVHLAGKDGYPW